MQTPRSMEGQMLPPIRQLLNDYLKLADELVAGATGQESAAVAAVTKDSQYLKALSALRLVAKQELMSLIQALSAWRVSTYDDVRSRLNASEYEIRQASRVRLVLVDCLFLLPAIQLMEELQPVQPLAPTMSLSGSGTSATPSVRPGGADTTPQQVLEPHVKFCTSVQEVCFQWLLNLDDYLPPPDMPTLRHHIYTTAARGLGAVSRVALSLVGNPFLQVLKRLVNPEKGTRASPDALRTQTLRLCAGMQFCVLSFGSESQLRQAVSFLEAAMPFNFTAAIKKSQVHHALADMLTKMLVPLVASGQPHMCDWFVGLSQSSLIEWHQLMARYKDAIWSWMQKHDKHIRVGWMLATVLVCLLDSEKYSAARDQAADFLLKQLRSRDYRGLAVRCLVLLVASLLVRFGKAHAMPRPELFKLCDKIMKGGKDASISLVTTARKGSLNTTEIQDMLMPMVELAPDYVLTILLDLMQTSDISECGLASLVTAHHLFTTPPNASLALLNADSALPTPQASSMNLTSLATLASTTGRSHSASGISWGSGAGANSTGGASGVVTGCNDMQELMRAGYQPADLLGLPKDLLTRFTASLGRMWLALHTAFGAPSYTSSSDAAQRPQGMLQFKWLIKLVPYTRPELWTTMKPLEYLPGYLSHNELQAVTLQALQELVRSCPHLRNMVLLGVAAHCCSIQEDNTRALREGLQCLNNLIDLWLTCVKERLAGEVHERSIPEAGLMDLHRLEGCVWASGLCCHDENVREQALQVLVGLRSLHQLLKLSPAYSPPPAPAPLATHLSQMASMVPSITGFNQSLSVSSPTYLTGGLLGAGPTGSASHENHSGMVHAAGSSTDSSYNRARSSGALGLTTSWSGAVPQSSANTAAAAVAAGNRGLGNVSVGLPTRPTHHHQGSHTSFGSSQDGVFGEQSYLSMWGGLIDLLDTDITYVADVLEQSGQDMVRAAYWDWGDLSNLWGQYTELPAVVASCQELLCTPVRDVEGSQRLTRLMIEIAKTVAVVCPVSSAACLHELCVGRLSRLSVKDKETGRMTVPLDPVDGSRRAEAWRLAGAVALALPSALKDHLCLAMSSQSLAGSQTGTPMVHSGSTASLASVGGGAPRHGRQSHSPQGLGMRDVVRCHVSIAAPGVYSASLQSSSIMALGHAHASHHELVLEEAAWLLDEATSSKPTRNRGMLLGLGLILSNEGGEYSSRGGATSGRSRVEEARRVVAHVMRLLSFHTPGELLGSRSQRLSLHRRILEWLKDTFLLLKDARVTSDLLWDNVQVAYCFASVVEKSAVPLCDSLTTATVGVYSTKEKGIPTSTSSLRKALYDLLATWTADAVLLEKEYRQSVNAGMRQTVDKLKVDFEGGGMRRDELDRELRTWSTALDHLARAAMAALLAGPAFDADARRPAGPVFIWVDRLLRHSSNLAMQSSTQAMSLSVSLSNVLQQATTTTTPAGVLQGGSQGVPGPPRCEVGRNALLNMLQANVDMFHVYLDKSYDAHPTVSSTYFQVLCEVYATADVSCAPHILVSLILYKMVDPIAEVREDARHMLGVLAQRVWGHQPSALLSSPGITNAGASRPLTPTRITRPGSAAGGLPLRTSMGGLSVSSNPRTPPKIPGFAPGGPPPLTLTTSPVIGPGAGGTPGLRSGMASSIDLTGCSVPPPSQGGAPAGDEGEPPPLNAWIPPDGGSAFSTLLDTYQENQHSMSELLASTHPEMSEALCEEMMTRALECSDSAIQQPVLTSLTPWMNNLTITAQWKGTWCERLLRSMYYVTQRHGTSCPYEVQTLWCTLAALKDNVRHMLLFLVDMGVAAGQQDMPSLEAYLTVSKRISLYLARTHPQFTIDQLQMEVSKQVQEPDSSAAATGSGKPPVEFEMLLGESLSGVTGGGADLDVGGFQGGSWSRAAFGMSLHASHDVQTTDWRLGAGLLDASSRTTRSVEGALMPGSGSGLPMITRIPSSSSSRSSTALSAYNDSARNLGPAGSNSKGDMRPPSSPHGQLSTVNSSAGGALVPGVTGSALDGYGVSDPGARAPRESGTSSSSHGAVVVGSAPAAAGGVLPGRESHGQLQQQQQQQLNSTQLRSTTGGRSLITRPELAICLLSEVAFACDEEFQGCLPLLLHACCVLLDAESPLVHNHAASLLTALIHSVGSAQQEAAQDAGQEVDLRQLHQLVCFLQSMRGRRLWAYEDITCAQPVLVSFTALRDVVQATVRALHWMPDVQVQWAEQAVEWALHCCSRHLSGRSFQVFRALQPPLDSDLLTTLLLCLHTCVDTPLSGSRGGGSNSAGGARLAGAPTDSQLADWAARSSADCALEVMLTLQTLVESCNPSARLVLYPQVFWLAVCLLHSPVVALYSAGLQLLAAFMRKVPLHQSKVLNVLLAAAPGLSGHILLHASSAAATSGRPRVSDKGGLEESEEPDAWVLGAALLQLPTHDTPGQRHSPLSIQQLLLRGLLVPDTLPDTLLAIADLAAVLEMQGAALHQSHILRDTTNMHQGTSFDGRDVNLMYPSLANPHATVSASGSGGPYDSLRKHKLMRLDAHQALLGPSHSQLFISCLAVLLHALAVNNTSVTSPQAKPESLASQAALAQCLTALGRACEAYGLMPLVAPLQQAAHVWADGTSGQVPLAYPASHTKHTLSRRLLKQLCAAFATVFFPRFGPLLLHHCLDCMSQSLPTHKHMAVLQLLQAMFSVLLDDFQAGGVMVGPGGTDSVAEQSVESSAVGWTTAGQLPLLGRTSLRILTSPALLKPLQDASQGATADAASDAMTAMMSYTAARWRAQPSLFEDMLASGLGLEAAASPGLPAGNWQATTKGQAVVPRTLYPAAVNTAAAIRRVVDTLGSSAWRGRRVARLLPHLSNMLRAQEG